MNQRCMRAKLIFNPSAGATRGLPIEMLDVIHKMQAWKLVPEAFLVKAGCDLPGAVQDALAQGVCMFVVCGGDGTLSAVARTLAGRPAKLEGLGTYTPNVGLDGKFDVAHRTDSALLNRPNTPRAFKGDIENRDMIGKTAADLVARWDAEHPGDKVA